MSSEMGTSQRARMYPSAEEIHGAEEMEGGSGDDDRVYVAVGKDVKESKHNLTWVVENFHGKRICIIHVLQPSQLIPLMGGKFHPGTLKEHVVIDHRDRERQSMQEVLKTYLSMLQQTGARGEAVHIEKGSVEEGIVELISLQRIKRLVIGAAANKHYHNRKMVDIRSKTAKYVHEHGHSSCHIWFICKGHLIKRREAAGASDDSGMPHRLSDCMSVSDVSPVDGTQYADSPQCSITMRDASDWNGMFRPSSSQSSSVSVPTVGYEPSAPAIELSTAEENEGGYGVEIATQYTENLSPPSVLDHGREAGNHEDVNNKIYFAVGSNIGGSWPNLSWVARNFPGQKICFLHILQPTKMIPSKHAPQGGEKKRIQDILKNYHPRLSDTGGVEEVYLKMQKVEEGIVTLISHLKIKNLVMGAAAGDKFYLRSKITKYVSVNGSESCQIWFLHEGHLIKTRYEQVITAVNSKKETYEESLRREKAEKESIEAVRKAKIAEKLQCKEMQLTRETKDATIRYASDWSEIFSSSSSQTSVSKVSSFSATYAPSAPHIVDFCHGNGSEEILMQTIAQPKEIISSPSLHNRQEEGTAITELYQELEQAMAEVENSKREAFEESSIRRKAKKDAVDASLRAKAAEIKVDSQLVAVMADRDCAFGKFIVGG